MPKVVLRVEAGYINLSLILNIGCLLQPRCNSLGVVEGYMICFGAECEFGGRGLVSWLGTETWF